MTLPAQPPTALVDTHCHVDLYPSPETIVKEADAAGIYTIAVTNAPSVFFHTRAITRGCRVVRPAIGLHPQLVKSHGAEVEMMWRFLEETRYVGEVGLDYSTNDRDDRRRQVDVFSKILERCAQYKDKILSVHSRRSATDVIAAVGDHFPSTVILHWFSGSLKELRTALGYGMYFSVNTAMVRSKNGQKLIAEIPRDRILTESDGPFVNFGPTPAKPSHVGNVLDYLATAWNVTSEEARRVVATNFHAAVGQF